MGVLLQELAEAYQGEADVEDFSKAAACLMAINVEACFRLLLKADPNAPENRCRTIARE